MGVIQGSVNQLLGTGAVVAKMTGLTDVSQAKKGVKTAMKNVSASEGGTPETQSKAYKGAADSLSRLFELRPNEDTSNARDYALALSDSASRGSFPELEAGKIQDDFVRSIREAELVKQRKAYQKFMIRGKVSNGKK